MKKRILTILTFCLVLSCSRDNNLSQPAESDKPIAMDVYCQNEPDDSWGTVEYGYNQGKLITEITTTYGKIESIKTYEYNSNNQLTVEIHRYDLNTTVKTFIYNEINQLINILYNLKNFDTNGQLISESTYETPLEYENKLLVKEWRHECGFITYDYIDGRVATMIEYTELGQKHHITRYKYSGDLVIEESKETAAGSMIYIRTFQYDSENRVMKIIEDGNIVEENIYNGNKLMEKRTYYFGIDPGFYFCRGNFIYRYEY